jgi:hypothetical protein
MLGFYIFSLVLGGGFLLISLFGDAFESDAGDVELDFDVDADLDLELDGGSGDMHASKIFSIRTVIYALFGFGAVGTLMSLLGSGAFLATLAFSIVGGILSGGLINTVFKYLKTTDSGAHPGDQSLVGLSGKVTLPLGVDVPGTITVERGTRRLTLRALPHASAPDDQVTSWTSVVVIEMDQGIARVAPLDDLLLADPD